MKRISVLIANYNGVGVIDDCIRSVLNQTGLAAEIEIIVHDDASTDGSVGYIRANYPEAQLIVSETNVGFCVANNRMARAASGDYLLLLNNDAALWPDALATLLEAAEMNSRGAVLGLPQYEFETGELLDMGSLLDPFLNPVPNLDASRCEVGMIMGACLWLPRALWFELGGFPEWFGSIGEDLYLCAVARLWGHPMRVRPVSGYRHRVGHSFGGGKVTRRQGLSTTFRRRGLTERNKTYAMIVTYPLLLLLLILPIHLSLLHAEGVILTLLKHNRSIWTEIYAPLLPALWRERARLGQLRRSVQSLRHLSMGEFLQPVRWLPRKLEMLWRHGLPELKRGGT